MTLKLRLFVLVLCACGEATPEVPDDEPQTEVGTTMGAPTGVHPGPVALPGERMVNTQMLDPRLLEDDLEDPEPTDPFAHEAPLDLSIIEDE